MDLIFSLILVLFVVILIVLFVTEPFTRRRRRKVEGSQVLSSLLAERDRVLTALKELDFDNSLGKIPVESYPEQRLSLVQQGAQILRSIDQLAPVPEPLPEPVPTGPLETGDPVEAFLAARRTRHSADLAVDKVAQAEAQDEAENLIARRRQNRTGTGIGTGKFCSHCGRSLLADDRFCPGCGHPVK